MGDEPRDRPPSARDLGRSDDGGKRLGRGGGRFEKKRRKRERRTGPEGGARLRPAREGMGESDAGAAAPPPPREFRAGDETWVAWEGGRATFGPRPAVGATVLEVYFGRDAEALRPERSALVVALSVEDIPLERLRSAWSEAAPYRKPREAGSGEGRGSRGGRRGPPPA